MKWLYVLLLVLTGCGGVTYPSNDAGVRSDGSVVGSVDASVKPGLSVNPLAAPEGVHYNIPDYPQELKKKIPPRRF